MLFFRGIALFFCFTTAFTSIPSPPAKWDVIGPFPFSYRELGADPLEAFGGISQIPRGDNSTYPSELGDGAKVGWSSVGSGQDGVVNISFPDTVRWDTFLAPFGWAGQMWQGWALGDFMVDTTDTYLVQCVDSDMTQTFTQSKLFIDDKILISGNTAAYEFAWFPVYLQTGRHTIRIKISGQGESEIYFCRFDMSSSPLRVIGGDDILPDIVNNSLASPFFSVALLNAQTTKWVTGLRVTCESDLEAVQSNGNVRSFSSFPDIAPGQIVALSLNLTLPAKHDCPHNFSVTISADGVQPLSYNLSVACKTWGEAYKFTFPDYDNTIHYCSVLPPLQSCPQNGCPVLLTTHGAGVEAGSSAWTGSYQRQSLAYILFPTGRRKFGYDWEGPGRLNALSSLNFFVSQHPGLPQDMKYMPDSQHILFAGHSMGGHGCLNLASHYPDLATGMACAAGWIKWQHYVPYYLRLGDSFSDPFLRSLLQASIAEHDTDLYVPNIANLPSIFRMGGDDTVVPPWNLRRMARLADELMGNSSAVIVSEIPGKPHWWDDVCDDQTMQNFFDRHLNTLPVVLPHLPRQFSLVTINPASSGSRGGMQVLQLAIPYRVGKLHVVMDKENDNQWVVGSQNVRRFGFRRLPDRPLPWKSLQLDGMDFAFNETSFPLLPEKHFCCMEQREGCWGICTGSEWEIVERAPSEYGPLRQILEGPLGIVYGTQGSSYLTDQLSQFSVWLANDMYQTGRRVLNSDVLASQSGPMNIILLGGPQVNLLTKKWMSSFQVDFVPGGGCSIGSRTYSGNGVGAIFLSHVVNGTGPINTSLVAVIASCDSEDVNGFEAAASLIPTHAGMMVPDWAIVGPSFAWSGVSGLLAAGYWSNLWAFDHVNSYLSS